MRLDTNDRDSAGFAQWLLDIGHGKDMPLDHMFKVPEQMLCGPTVEELISSIYPNIDQDEALIRVSTGKGYSVSSKCRCK